MVGGPGGSVVVTTTVVRGGSTVMLVGGVVDVETGAVELGGGAMGPDPRLTIATPTIPAMPRIARDAIRLRRVGVMAESLWMGAQLRPYPRQAS